MQQSNVVVVAGVSPRLSQAPCSASFPAKVQSILRYEVLCPSFDPAQPKPLWGHKRGQIKNSGDSGHLFSRQQRTVWPPTLLPIPTVD